MTPAALQKATIGTDVSPSNFANVQTALLTLASARDGWIIRNAIGNTQILYLRFALTPGNVAITDALAHWALAPGDSLNSGVIDYCGPVWGSFGGPVAEKATVVTLT